jgi:hypothetical protein
MPIAGVGEFSPNEGENLLGVGRTAVNALRRVEVSEAEVVPPTLQVPPSARVAKAPLVSLSTTDTNFLGRGFYRQSTTEGDAAVSLNLANAGRAVLGAPRFVAIPDFISAAPVPQYGRRYGVFETTHRALATQDQPTLGLPILGGFEFVNATDANTVRVWLTPSTFRLNDLVYPFSPKELTALRTGLTFRIDVYRTSSGFWAGLSFDGAMVRAGLTSSPQPLLGPLLSFSAPVSEVAVIGPAIRVDDAGGSGGGSGGGWASRLVETDHTSCVALGYDAVPLEGLRVASHTLRAQPWSRCFVRGTKNLGVEWCGVEMTRVAGTYSA